MSVKNEKAMDLSILIVEDDETTIDSLKSIGEIYGLPIHIESNFSTAKSYFENHNCIIALQEIIINNKTSVSLFDVSRNPDSKNFETPIAIMNSNISNELNKKLRKRVFGIINKPFDQAQLEKTLKILVSSSQIIKMGKTLSQMKFIEQIMAVEGITETVVKLSTIATGFLKEDKPFDTKAANVGINEFMMIIEYEEDLQPPCRKLIQDLESSIRNLYDLLQHGSVEPLSSWMIDGIFTFYSSEDLVISGQEIESEQENEALTPEQIDALMNSG